MLSGGDGEIKISADSHHLDQVRSEFPDYEALVAEARDAQDAEKAMTFREALRRYPKAIGWSMVISAAIIMEGYDLTLMSSLFAQPQFSRFYGEPIGDGEYEVTAAWQSGLQNGVQVGSIIGLTIGGQLTDRLGYRWTMIGSMFFMTAFIFLPVFAQNVEMLLAGQILCGLPWGVFQSITTAYASEVSPACLRHYLTAYVNLCWVIGQVIASGTLRGCLNWESQWAYRLPFALQWLWPVPIAVGCFLAPDSPWWQVRHNKLDDARRTIKRLNRNITEKQIDAQLALIMHTNAMEKAVSEGTQYWDCFKGIDRRRTEIAAGTWLVQNASGSAFIGWSTYFLTRAGLALEMSFTMTIIQYAIGALGTISSWITMAYFGRKTLYMFGLGLGTVLLLIIGGLGFISNENSGASWGIGALLLAFAVLYQATVGPVTYVIVAESSSTRLRAKTIVIARITYNIVGIINNIIMPQFLNAGALNWGGRTGLFWGGLSALCLVWVYFRQPEMKGRTYGELDTLFEQRVSARKFAKTKVDQFHTSAEAGEAAERNTIVESEKAKAEGGRSEEWVEGNMPRGTA